VAVEVKDDAAAGYGNYPNGGRLNLAGLVLTATYDDGTTQNIISPWSGVTFKIGGETVARDIALSNANHGGKTLTAEYGGKSATLGTLVVRQPYYDSSSSPTLTPSPTPAPSPAPEPAPSPVPDTGIGAVSTPDGGDPVDNGDGTVTLPRGGKLTAGIGTEISLPGGTVVDGEKITVGKGGAAVTTEKGAELKLIENASIVVALGSPLGYAVVPEAPFSDVAETDWFRESVAFAWAHGLFSGVGGAQFSPNSPVTRGMLATVLYRLANEPGTNAGNPFSDVPGGSYYEKAVVWAAERGIVNGVSADAFAPDADITREQVATILHRYASEYLKTETPGGGDLRGYADAGKISGYAAEPMSWAVATGLITGRTRTELAPQGNATRAEVAEILKRFVEAVA
jgi:hypothetical protein